MNRAAFVFFALLAAPAAAEPIAVKAQPLSYFSAANPGQNVFGALTFRGGLVLTSDNKDFGGISGVRLAADGKLVAVTDRGQWLTGKLTYDGAKPLALEGAELAPMLNANGKALRGGGADVESLEVSGNTAFAGIERVHQVLRYDLSKGVSAAKGTGVTVPREAKSFPSNGGIEGLALVPGGAEKDTLLIVTEEAYDAKGDHLGFLLPGRTKKKIRPLTLKRRDNYAVTDLAFLPGGDLIVLERRYVPPFSLSTRLRRIVQSSITEGALLDGEVLLEGFFPADQIDNMEAVSAHKAADGASVITLMSDDNFSQRQRTILLQFGIAD
ncbi:hypothetical protein IZ6_03160 [Terrihabitans soli]|uniref:Phytase-like domain-containing protein n=1 Tax=Terrihabitans soli TaxID=708113 RepID=A0A6S6QRA8_9HYPH|nr:esterase-like activity of phytase family protein [Terrihabitans soli]BCJ89581.1 hypothetical protein IZ6_03160 [Terrihabitans soli]